MSSLKIKVTSDKGTEQRIREALRDNDGYCPCRIARTPETKCMCKEFLESKEAGFCHCGLYYKEEIDD